MRIAIPLLLLALLQGCFWRIARNRREDELRSKTGVALSCPADNVDLEERDEGYRARGCGREAYCTEQTGNWVCKSVSL